MSDTPETDAMCICTHHKSFAAIGGVVNPDFARRLERERDDWKSRFIQQNKDLGCEMMDPGGTIWDYAKKLQEENKALQEQLDAALMLGKMQGRRHQRELEQVREQNRLSSVCRKLMLENQQLKECRQSPTTNQ